MKIEIDKVKNRVIFKCKNKEEIRLVLDRFIAGCQEEVKQIRQSLEMLE